MVLHGDSHLLIVIAIYSTFDRLFTVVNAGGHTKVLFVEIGKWEITDKWQDSFGCCTAEMNIILYVNCTSIKTFKKNITEYSQ